MDRPGASPANRRRARRWIATAALGLFAPLGCGGPVESLAGASDTPTEANLGAVQTPQPVASPGVAATAGAAPRDQQAASLRPEPRNGPESGESAGQTLDRSFDDLKFDLPVGGVWRRELLTPEIESLAGRRIRIRGYILPTSQKRGLKSFVLVRDNLECCFGPGAALYDCVLVEMQPGRSAEFSIRPVAVEGEFQIREFPGPDGAPLAVYHLEGLLVR